MVYVCVLYCVWYAEFGFVLVVVCILYWLLVVLLCLFGCYGLCSLVVGCFVLCLHLLY